MTLAVRVEAGEGAPVIAESLIRCDIFLVSMGLFPHSSYQVINPREE
jgi:hypothetical protein